MNYFRVTLIIPLLIIASFNFAQTKDAPPFNLDFTREAVLIGTGTAAAVTAYVIFSNIQSLTPEEINSLNPADVNGFDRGAIGTFKDDNVGNALLYSSYLLPLTFLLYDQTNKDFINLALMYGEVLLIEGSVIGIVKGTVQRTRPFVYDSNTPMSEKTAVDARVSFFSGHTATTAAISFFTAKVFSEYVKDNTARILIWSGAAIYPALTALTRVNTHHHFPTDVMAGYVFGALVGYFIPELHKNNVSESVSIHPSYNFDKPTLSIQIKF